MLRREECVELGRVRFGELCSKAHDLVNARIGDVTAGQPGEDPESLGPVTDVGRNIGGALQDAVGLALVAVKVKCKLQIVQRLNEAGRRRKLLLHAYRVAEQVDPALII